MSLKSLEEFGNLTALCDLTPLISSGEWTSVQDVPCSEFGFWLPAGLSVLHGALLLLVAPVHQKSGLEPYSCSDSTF